MLFFATFHKVWNPLSVLPIENFHYAPRPGRTWRRTRDETSRILRFTLENITSVIISSEKNDILPSDVCNYAFQNIYRFLPRDIKVNVLLRNVQRNAKLFLDIRDVSTNHSTMFSVLL